MFKPAAILIGAAILLAGCASTPTVPEEVISSPPVMTGEASSLNWTDPNAVKQFPAARSFRPATQPPRPIPRSPRRSRTWTSWIAGRPKTKLASRVWCPTRLWPRTPSGRRTARWFWTSAAASNLEQHRNSTGFHPEFIDTRFLSTASICRKTSDRCCRAALTFGIASS